MSIDRAKLLIVNADDFGITEGATEAIVACHLAGSVTSTTLMTNMPAAAHAAQRAKEHPMLGVGLHFNLTSGRALALDASTGLIDADGLLPSRRALALRAISGRLRSRHVREELEAQHAAMLALGLVPSHVDSHQHVHAIPGVFQAVAAFASEHRLPMRMPWGWSGRIAGKRLGRKAKEHVLHKTLTVLDRLRPRSLPVNDGFCSVFDLDVPSTRLRLEDYRVLLAPYRAGVVELMVHPAYVDDDLLGQTAITGTSDVEQRLLMDAGFRAQAEALGFRLGSYRDLV